MLNGSLNNFSRHNIKHTNGTSAENHEPTPTRDIQTEALDGTTHHTSIKAEYVKYEDQNIDAPPNKKRKLADPSARQRSTSRHISPPWRKVAVEGPTSFVEGGRRKSSRTNLVPLELQPQADKRQTRATIQKTHLPKSTYGGAKSYKQSRLTPIPTQSQVNGKPLRSSSKSVTQPVGRSPGKWGQQNGTSTSSTTTNATPIKAHPHTAKSVKLHSESPRQQSQKHHTYKARHKLLPAGSSQQPSDTSNTHPIRRSGRASRAADSADESKGVRTNGWPESDEEEVPVDPNFKPQRLKFKVRMPTVTIQHPGHVPPKRQFSSFREWLEHDDPLAGDDSGHQTDEKAEREAELRRRILLAAKAGGVLSRGHCSVYVPDPQEEPPTQYAHQDHLVAHAIYFRKLMKQEQRHHLASAKRIAYAAAAEWKRRQPKSEEEVEQEQREAALARYKQVRKDLMQKWEIVTVEVNRRRLARWEEEQQVLGKQALNRVLEQSTQLLDKRRLRGSSDAGTEDEKEDGNEDDDEEEEEEEEGVSDDAGSDVESGHESNMSSSQSESEASLEIKADDDEGLTVDELRRKYAAVPRQSPGHHSDVQMDEAQPEESCLQDRKVEVERLSLALSETQDEIVAEPDPGSSVDPLATVHLDDVDDALLDDSDSSTDMEYDMGDSDEESEFEEDGESEASEEERGLLGFFSKSDLQEAQTPDSDMEGPNMKGEASDGEIEEASLIPDATQVQTPSASNSEEPSMHTPKKLEVLTSGEITNPAWGTRNNDILRPISTKAQAGAEPSTSMKTPGLETPMNVHRESLPTTPVSAYTLKTTVPFLLRGTLREYQHYGLDWLAGLYANGTNGILADEMGLGKTIQTIALLAHLAVEHEVWGPHLIVVPTSVMLNWEMEFKKFLPGFKILTYYGTQEERKQKRKGWLDDNRWNVCVTSYQLVLQDQQTFKRRGWHYMVLDEAHNIKNFRSQRWQTLLTFRTRARLLLTGTPLQNNLTELWSLLFFLMPSDSTETGIGGFADLQEFSNWFRKPVEQILEHGRETMDDEAKLIVQKLHKVLRPYLLRRLKADVEKQMPAKYEHVVYCRLSKRQRYLYDGFMSRAQTRETLASGNYLSIINCLMQLRKVCNHPDLFETRQIVTSFAMPKSAIADFEIKELLVRRRLLQEDPMRRVDLDVINLLPGANGPVSALATIQNQRLGALHALRQLAVQQQGRLDWKMQLDGTSIESNLAHMENAARISRLEELRHCAYLTSLRSQRRPLYSYSLVERLTLDLQQLPTPPMPKRRVALADWYSNTSPAMEDMVLTLSQRSEAVQTTIQKFACVTPAAVATDMTSFALSRRGVEVIHDAQQVCKADAFHEARMRLSIAFPDKRLLQYDCGKLQRLDKLLRDLQAGGHRALIFTQMTKVLDILEQFLNIHGHRYLRLDGATKIEQRQILTDRFNNDNRILAFILSTRSGGLGINLTGADTVIFYDLDWNPAMDKQCQDRCHRIGQTRDVHIYRLVSEYTIEANILRKANQKRMLDDVVIQEGEFTTDYFNKLNVQDMLDDEALDGDAEANAAMDRVLGGGGAANGKGFEQVEDKEDIAAAKVAEKEMIHTDEADFDEKAGLSSAGGATPRTPGPPTPSESMPARIGTPDTVHNSAAATDTAERVTTLEATESVVGTPGIVNGDEVADDADEDEATHVDEYIIRFLEWELRDVAVAPPGDKSKKKSKKGGEHRVRRPR
ncbi:helicase swr1 [Lasallia pustulata]|uniref:DNA helicase n=1 Tax=Lasallia pustulata TaxID=136370 RepID=A0A1W5D1B4_9LECA|nr:helicase swr1 [Lasallia pustulata]